MARPLLVVNADYDPSVPLAEALVIDSGDDVEDLARAHGIDPAWASAVATGAVSRLDVAGIRRACEALRCTPYDLWGVANARSIARAYGPLQLGLHLLGELADRVGLTSGYSAAVPWAGERAPGHDRGRLFTHVAVSLPPWWRSTPPKRSEPLENRMDEFLNFAHQVTTEWLAVSATAATAEPLRVTVEGEDVPVMPDGSFSGTVPVAPNRKTVEVVMTDGAGKQTGEHAEIAKNK